MAKNPYRGKVTVGLVALDLWKAWDEGYNTGKAEDADLLEACEGLVRLLKEAQSPSSGHDIERAILLSAAAAAIEKHKAKGE